MLYVKTGKFHPSLENELANFVRAVKDKNKLAPLAIIAPSNYIIRHLKRLLAEKIPDGVIQIRFYNLFGLALDLAKESRKFHYSHFIKDDNFFRFITSEFLQGFFGNEKYPYLSAARCSKGLAGALYEVIKDLRDSGVNPDSALEALKERFASKEIGGALEPHQEEKIADVLQLYKAYEVALKNMEVYDTADIVRIAVENVYNSATLEKFEHLIYYGFYDLVGVQLDLFQEIAKNYNTTLFYPLVDSEDYSFASDFFTKYIRGAAAKVEKTPSQSSQPSIKVFSTAGAKDEAWVCAKEIAGLLDAGYKPTDIAVVARTLEPYADIIEEVFEENLIPYNLSSPQRLTKHQLTKTIYKLFFAAKENFPRKEVMDTISSPYFRMEGEKNPLWDLLTIYVGIVQGADQWLECLAPWTQNDRGMRRLNEEDASGSNIGIVESSSTNVLYDGLKNLFEDFSAFPQNASWTEFTEKSKALLEKYIQPDDESREIFETIVESLDTFKLFDSYNPTTTKERFLDEALNLFDGLSLDNRVVNGVWALDAMAARALSFKAVFVIGLNEKMFPRLILEDPFISDDVRERLSFTLGNKLPIKLAGYDEEKLLFKMLCDGSSEKLYFVYQRSDENGRLKIPSPYIRSAIAIREPIRLHDKLTALQNEGRANILSKKETAILLGLNGISPDDNNFKNSENALKAIYSKDDLTGYDGCIEPADISGFLQRGLSPSSIKDFYQCPFKYFGRKILGIEKLPDDATLDNVDSLVYGKLVHKILANFYEEASDLNQAAQKAFLEYEEAYPVFIKGLWNIKKAEILEEMARFLDEDAKELQQSGFTPRFFERNAEADFRDIKLHGVIDRIDTKNEGDVLKFRVVDYKTGKAKDKPSIKEPQLLVYLLLAERILADDAKDSRMKKQKMTPHGASYYYLSKDGLEQKDFSVEDFSEEDFMGKLRLLKSVIAGKTFFIHPDHHCRWCNFSAICRKNHYMSSFRAKNVYEGNILWKTKSSAKEQ